MKNLDNISQANPWLSEVFRLTIFFQNPGTNEVPSWWQQVTGDTPETRNQQPKSFIFQDEGPFEGGRLVMTAQPGRVDWLFLPSFNSEAGIPNYSDLFQYNEKIGVLIKIAERFFKICPDTTRLALGMVLNIPVKDRASGYYKLSQYLPTIKLDPENSSDFLYQINRPRISEVIKDLRINRLSKWSVSTFQQIPVSAIGTPSSPLDMHIFTRLELDINTTAENNKFLSQEQYLTILHELINLAIEICDKGDIK